MKIADAFTQLEENGYFVWDDFLSPEELLALRNDFQRLHAEGRFKRAGIGKAADHHLNQDVRRDEILWFEENELTSAQKIFWEKLGRLKEELNAQFFLGLWEFEGHFAYYPVGGIYQAHVDRFSNDDARTISMVFYLNPDWKPGDGGELRIHPRAAGSATSVVDLAPIASRLVCFFSADILHEVLPAQRPRYSFAGWWKRRTI